MEKKYYEAVMPIPTRQEIKDDSISAYPMQPDLQLSYAGGLEAMKSLFREVHAVDSDKLAIGFSEWLGNNNWKAVACLPVNGSQIWEQGEQFNSRKSTPDLLAMYLNEKQK